MFLCVCSAITEDQVEWAVRVRGADSVEGVFQALDARPDCGRCQAFLEERVLAIRAGERVRVTGLDEGTTPWGCRGRCRPAWTTPAASMDLAS